MPLKKNTLRHGAIVAGTLLLGAGIFFGVSAMRQQADIKAGQRVYFDHCAVCHAPDGSGVEYQGLPLMGNTFMTELSDAALKTFIKVGRLVESPDSKMDDPMLPVDYLEEAEYDALIRYLRRMNSP